MADHEYTITFPLMSGDEHLSARDIQFKYSLAEAMAWLAGGITPVELADLGLPDAWPVISRWVDDVRAGK